MEKIKRLVLGLIPNQKCNLKCEYCYISQVNAWSEPTPLKYPPEYIAKCLSKMCIRDRYRKVFEFDSSCVSSAA